MRVLGVVCVMLMLMHFVAKPILRLRRQWLLERLDRVTPIRSTRRDAKREAKAFASKLKGRPLRWKKARKVMNALERDAKRQAAG